jgi:hypothetical protein
VCGKCRYYNLRSWIKKAEVPRRDACVAPYPLWLVRWLDQHSGELSIPASENVVSEIDDASECELFIERGEYLC